MSIKRERLKVYDMTCISCESRVERSIKKLNGVLNVKANYTRQSAIVEYDEDLCSIRKIKTSIRNAGYSTEKSNGYKIIGLLIIVTAIVLLGLNTSGFDMDSKLNNASYAVLFIVGIFTSIHCIGMCGGIMLSQSLLKESKNKFQSMQPAMLYNLGRVISYTILGGLVGAIGSVFSLSIMAKAALQIFAGIFMVIMGFNMAGFSIFRRFNLKLPSFACNNKNKSRTPFLVGLLNGLMPCGPLQTMQLFALGTGSAVKGALSMFIFALGTVPLMLTFGAISGLLSKSYTKKILKFSGILIVVLGLIMGNRGLSLAGISINPLNLISSKIEEIKTTNGEVSSSTNNKSSASSDSSNKATLENGVQILKMTASSRGYTPSVSYIEKRTPVKLIVDGKQLNSCNSTLVIPSLNKQLKLKSGENILEFTPGSKDIKFSCWMGMIGGTIKVVDDLDSISGTSGDSSGDTSSESASQEIKTSIYGNDISKVSTDRLVKKAQTSNKNQDITIKGIGYEIDPLIIVINKGINTNLSLDLNSFDNPESDFFIKDMYTGDLVKEFTGKKGVIELKFTIDSSGPYGIFYDGQLLGLIESVTDMNSINLEEIRNKYIK